MKENARLLAVQAVRQELATLGIDPFGIQIDEILSPTEGLIQGRQTILAGTNNYLGLTFDPDCIAAARDALQSSGTGTTGSRMANGSYAAHRELELDLARFYGKRDAIVFSTGYQANLGMISALAGPGDTVLIDADSHASIYDGCNLSGANTIRFRHNDPEDLYKRLRRMKDVPGERLIVVEGIYSMIGDTAPLKEIAAVKRELGGYLLVDEAHSMGVLGEHGRGLAELAGVEDDVDFVVGTFSKSLGAIGGFCVSDMDDFDVMRVTCRPYMFTASLPPAVVSSTVTALRRLEEQPELRHKLMANARRLYDGLSAMGYITGPTSSPIVAITMPDTERAIGMWNALLQNGVYLNLALPPATPDSRPLLRTSVSAAHSEQQIDQVLAVFAEIGAAMGLIEAPLKRVSA